MGRLTITDLQKYYGRSQALCGIDLDIPEGQFMVFVGPSGCGKSTLLRCIAGLEPIDSGTVAIDGQIMNAVAPRDRDIAMVFQNYALYPFMNVFENIAFGLRARKVVDAEVRTRVHQAADMLGIGGYLQRLPRQLSGGQRQRVAIGRAIVRDARLFLFDEPLSNLDAQLREEMRSEIKRLHQEIGKTMVYVTHDQVEAMTLADRIVLLKEGRIEQTGAPLDLFERPRTRFVASFIGSPTINRVPCHLEQTGEQTTMLFEGGHRVALPAERGTSLVAHLGKPLEAGIRAEHLRADPAGELEVMIDMVQPTGSRSFGTFQLAGIPVVAELEAHDIERSGTRMRLALDGKRCLLIDPESGDVIHA